MHRRLLHKLTNEEIVEGVVLLLHLLPEEHRQAEQVADQAQEAQDHVAVPAQNHLVLSVGLDFVLGFLHAIAW